MALIREVYGMICCEKCFDDIFLKEKIIVQNKKGDCYYCGGKDVFITDVKQLSPYFLRLINLYNRTEAYEHYNPEVDHPLEVGNALIALINEDWSIFSKDIQDYEIDFKLLYDILNENNQGKYYDPKYIYSKITDGKSYNDPLAVWKIYWDKLKSELKHENRFFPFFDINTKILEVLKYRNHNLKVGDVLFRARIGEQVKENMLAPPSKIAKSGRANPNGISYLYCADDKETCIAEIRPWKGAVITVASMEVNKNLKLVDLSDNKFTPLIFEDFNEILALDTLITRFSSELSTPVDPSSSEIDYLPTQYLTELIKVKGYDGIYFKSAMGPKYNLVIFNEENVTVKDVENVQIKEILYKTSIDDFNGLLELFD
ncbi:RES family NAD+ phosphorylase [Rummeliibacillus sp. TYF-LIM-RU47]|uniref:RES family NAD+ phosphorylase n=1 Tax=Rummeliibacillus sp. TYF-LIM-RU47 TaxID=2608406 RepID=UPI0012389442|nr:RES family NAD+ phosphorylase [Rummeliibacillus sp. TYF-LIM-RU47]